MNTLLIYTLATLDEDGFWNISDEVYKQMKKLTKNKYITWQIFIDNYSKPKLNYINEFRNGFGIHAFNKKFTESEYKSKVGDWISKTLHKNAFDYYLNLPPDCKIPDVGLLNCIINSDKSGIDNFIFINNPDLIIKSRELIDKEYEIE